MALDDLATTTDLAAWMGRALTAVEATRAAPLLASASAAVRAEVRQQITRSTTTRRVKPWADIEERVGTRCWPAYVILPQRPVNAVTAVVDLDGTAVEYLWVGDDKVLVVAPGGPVDVTYDHGFDADTDTIGVLAAVKGVVCQIVGRALGVDVADTAYSSEQVDGYSQTLGSAASAGPFGMLDAEEETLCDLFPRRKAGTIRLA